MLCFGIIIQDLVKSHLMYAVREEVEVLKEQIKELYERNSLLERENAVLKSLANNEQLSQLPTPPTSNPTNAPSQLGSNPAQAPPSLSQPQPYLQLDVNNTMESLPRQPQPNVTSAWSAPLFFFSKSLYHYYNSRDLSCSLPAVCFSKRACCRPSSCQDRWLRGGVSCSGTMQACLRTMVLILVLHGPVSPDKVERDWSRMTRVIFLIKRIQPWKRCIFSIAVFM